MRCVTPEWQRTLVTVLTILALSALGILFAIGISQIGMLAGTR